MGRRSREIAARRDRRAAQHESRLQRAEEGRRRGCLFCRRSDGGFLSVEHVIPESLGNTDLLLPNGVVCDHCNNNELAHLDQELGDFLPIKARRTMLGIRSKSGILPELKFSRGLLRNEGGDHLILTHQNNADRRTLREIERTGPQVRLEFNFGGGKRMTPRYASQLSRGLLKFALEAAWLDHGAAMLDCKFDHVRDAVLGKPRDGYVMFARAGDPADVGATVQYQFDTLNHEGSAIAVATSLLGTGMATHSIDARPFSTPPDASIQVFDFTAADFKRQGGSSNGPSQPRRVL